MGVISFSWGVKSYPFFGYVCGDYNTMKWKSCSEPTRIRGFNGVTLRRQSLEMVVVVFFNRGLVPHKNTQAINSLGDDFEPSINFEFHLFGKISMLTVFLCSNGLKPPAGFSLAND